jgi:serine/threonine protein kinase
MTNDLDHEADREQRLNEVLLAYVEDTQAGRRPDRSVLLAAHPDLRAELEEFFAGDDEVNRLTAPLRSTNGSFRSHASGEPEGLLRLPLATYHPPLERATQPLGDFRLLREVGRGGMGVVYEAEQISLRRRVALKVLPFAAALDPRQLQRFQNEALAAAHLHHENIVPVYAVGSERGIHFYAMQFIDGQSLAGLIADLRRHGEPTTPHSSPVMLTPSGLAADTAVPSVPLAAQDTQVGEGDRRVESLARERSTHGRKYFAWVADLGRQAALALEHAHQTGIVHRDVKPANLLLDTRGQLWITDFGLAQFTGNLGLTVTGEVLGTMRYASPEQALGRPGLVDHRSDVYSLGATLYELLTLQPIFTGHDRHELLRQIANEDPRSPRSLNPAIPVELETILLKALAKETSERYTSAQELAEDLQRFLEDRPIRARRPTLLENATRWARRHRSVVASALAALLLCVAGLSLATLLTAQAYDRERQKAREADEQRARAEESFRQARQAVELFEQIGEEELAGRPGQRRVRQRLLEAALAYYQNFIDQRSDDPSIQAELEVSRDRVTAILEELAIRNRSYQYIHLHRKDVQDDLHLIREKRDALGRMQQRWWRAFAELGTLEPAKREARRKALVREQETEVAQLLTPAQLQRFKQVGIQLLGPAAFSDSEVVKTLQLTPEQRQKIQPIQNEPEHGPGPTFWEETRKRKMERILVLLSPQQRQKWQELVGKPFREKSPFDAPWFGARKSARKL